MLNNRLLRVLLRLAGALGVLLFAGAPTSWADTLPPLLDPRFALCVTDSNGQPLNQIPFRGQTIRLYSIIGGSFGGMTLGNVYAGGTPLFPGSEVPKSVIYTIHYEDGPLTISAQAYKYVQVTIVSNLAQPYVEASAAPSRAAGSPYEVTLSARQNFTASPDTCSNYIDGQFVPHNFTANTSAVPDPYVAEYVAQSGLLTMTAGSKAQAWIDLKNTGNVAWTRGIASVNGRAIFTPGAVMLGTDSPQDRSSPFYVEGDWSSNGGDWCFPCQWWSPNRVAVADKDQVNPGETVRFSFTLQAPTTPGSYEEYFRLVVEGYTWFNDLGIHFPIWVQATPLTGLDNKVYAPLLTKASSGW